MIPILLNKEKSLPTLVSDITGGIGEITGAYKGVAIEEGNGLKELSFKLPINSPRYSQVKVGSWIKAKADEYHGLQIYEVYRITKPINGIVTIYAEHISYMLAKATVKPFTATGITMVTTKMIQNLVGTFPFTFDSDIVNATSEFKLEIPMSFRKAIGGWKGSILDIFGGELDWDNLNVHLYAHRGQDRGVKVEYGKNLTSLTQEESIANVYDAVIGYATINEVTHVGDIQKITVTDSPRTQNVDFSGNFDTSEELTDEQIKTRLNAYALAYAQNNDIGKPKVNLKISFEALSKFEEYKDIAVLEQTGLFDTIYVLFPKLGVESKAKIIRTEYDFINEKMISVELGDAKTNLLGLVDEQIESQMSNIDADVSGVEKAIGFLDGYVDNLSQIISNGLGLFFTKVEKADGSYQYYLHDKPRLSDSQNQWTINAGGFALSTDGGQTWVAGIDAQGNAVLNSLSTVVLNALKIYGSYIQGSEIVFGNPSDATSKYITAKPYSESGVVQGVSFDGSGTIRLRPQEQLLIDNMPVNSTNYYNRLNMSKTGDLLASIIGLYNKDDLNGYLMANYLELNAHVYNSAQDEYYNRTIINNFSTASGTHYNGNYFAMNAFSNRNYIYFYNYKPLNAVSDIPLVANYLQFTANSTTVGTYLYNYYITGNYQANRFSMFSNSVNNAFLLVNNKISGNYLANTIGASVSSSSSSISLTNVKMASQTATGANSDWANRIELGAFSDNNTININNYRPTSDSDLYANRIYMYGTPTGGGSFNRFRIENYDVDGANLSNYIDMYKNTAYNNVEIVANRGGQRVAFVTVEKKSNGTAEARIGTQSNSTYGYSSAQIACDSNGDIWIIGRHVYFNGAQKW